MTGLDPAWVNGHVPPSEADVETAPRRVEWLRSLRDQWWAHLLIAATLALVFNGETSRWENFAYSFLANLVLSICIGSATTAVYVFVWGTVQIPGHPIRRAVCHGGSIITGVVVGTELALNLMRLSTLIGVEISIYRFGIWRVGLAVTVIAMLTSVTYDGLRQRVRTVELRAQRAQQALLRAQFENLQAKVNPHFLFNALNTVASLVEEEPDTAVEAIERLSALLRRSLEHSRRGAVPVTEEIDAVRSYLALERLRFGERLRSTVAIDPAVAKASLPPFVIQPLVENAVKHGIAARREGGTITVTVDPIDDDRMRVRVHDDGPGDFQGPGTQSGQTTLRQRLELLYGNTAQLSAGRCPDGSGYEVTIALPRAMSASALPEEAGS